MPNQLRALTLAAVVLTGAGVSAETAIRIVYPKPGQTIAAVDSSFIFGSITGGFDRDNDTLTINDQSVEVHRDGGFLAFLPLAPGEFIFRIRALRPRELPLADDTLQRQQLLAEDSVKVVVPTPRRSLPDDTLAIVGDYNPPSGDLVLSAGDLLHVMFQGSPRMPALFSIPGVVDSVPMNETDPRQQPYWGEAVFGDGAVPDSLMIEGIYSGVYVVPESVSVVDKRIIYHLATPPKKYIHPRSGGVPDSAFDDRMVKLAAMPDSLSRESGYRISLNHPEYPFTVRFLDSIQTLRHGPRLGYFTIFQPAGVEALVVGREGDWYRAKFSKSQYAWIDRNLVTPLPRGVLPPRSMPTTVRTYGHDDHVLLEVGLSGKHPFRVYEDNARTLRLQLFGVTSNTDWIRYDFSDPMVELAVWSQPETDLYELKLTLTRDVWGYDTYYRGNTFCLRINRPPEHVDRLKGKIIVVDPGHASDPGAVGPTGLTEAEANLRIALALRRELQRHGASVVMTRYDMSHVSLNDRPVIAKNADADLFVSIHNNALPDGVHPFNNHGVSTYYYHPHSARLARAIQRELLRATEMPDFGLYHGNLAVNRPTQYPAVLVECAFMMIPEHEAELKTERYRNKVAEAITRGIDAFLDEYAHRNK
ncbi:MAG: N-acetylmuramoyl-L-alanine amidase [Candidatus Zixiibacteriota bacterium]